MFFGCRGVAHIQSQAFYATWDGTVAAASAEYTPAFLGKKKRRCAADTGRRSGDECDRRALSHLPPLTGGGIVA